MTHDTADADLFDNPVETNAELSSFLPLRVEKSLVGTTHIADASGATFLDRAFQVRGFQLRPGFKDEWDGLAPQIVDRINRFDAVKEGAGKALEALQEASGIKLPPQARKAFAKALAALAEAVKR